MEKFHQMKLNSDLGATVLTRSVDIRGSGAYLNEQRPDFPAVHQALYYTLETVHEKLNLSDGSIKDYLDAEQLNNKLATHIATEITWGASCIVSATKRLSGGQDPDFPPADNSQFRDLESVRRHILNLLNGAYQRLQREAVGVYFASHWISVHLRRHSSGDRYRWPVESRVPAAAGQSARRSQQCGEDVKCLLCQSGETQLLK